VLSHKPFGNDPGGKKLVVLTGWVGATTNLIVIEPSDPEAPSPPEAPPPVVVVTPVAFEVT
jgi:hypothetical protein